MPEASFASAVPVTGTGPIFSLDGVTPKVAPDAFVAPSAAVIGDVEIGPETGIWFHCLVRGDMNIIRIGARTNIQDGTVIHVDSGGFATYIGDDVTVGHNAVIHACTLKNRAFVGISATVLDGAVIEEGGMLAAGGLLTPGKRIGPMELWAGAPAKLLRVMSPEERAKFDRNAVVYRDLAKRYRAGLRSLG
ncbi:MAG: gamma carbonic anhydrase family protein [Rhodospirillales bacterium 69-11]|nr:gamma carbonic anhydrase family protein [Rhodospirillales bacterium]MBN8925145.1 gamma carbonic anhydrase family protein [Rhodospirillales bacterium]OJW27237.1 MAG: gamma carbonic anhydrase family protein [Rhodospirillales bacterium 69-11]